MSKTTYYTSLSPNELKRLDAFLHQFPGAMNLETMDGFFSALICTPQTVIVNSVCSKVWGRKARFNDIGEAYEITNLIVRHWNNISQTLNQGDLYYPLLVEDSEGIVHANDWAYGFNIGIQFSDSNWVNLLQDETHKGWLFPIFALAYEHHPDPEMRPSNIDDRQRQTLISALVVGLKRIHDYFLEHGRGGENQTIKNQQPKRTIIRRNEPCPCGSGRKYKQCCGSQADHLQPSRTLH
jgi:uncharacterized protein